MNPLPLILLGVGGYILLKSSQGEDAGIEDEDPSQTLGVNPYHGRSISTPDRSTGTPNIIYNITAPSFPEIRLPGAGVETKKEQTVLITPPPYTGKSFVDIGKQTIEEKTGVCAMYPTSPWTAMPWIPASVKDVMPATKKETAVLPTPEIDIGFIK